MVKPTEYRMGESLFMIRPFEPFEAMHVLGELKKVLAPIIGGGVKGFSENALDMDVRDLRVWADVIGGVLNNLGSCITGEQMEHLARQLLRPDYIAFSPDGTERKLVKFTEDMIDEYFTGRPIDLIILMVQVVKVNYLDFSKLSGVPTGLTKAFGEISSAFRENFQTDSAQ